MAIISIPTSIGGLSIPGGLLGGPLGSLYESGGLDFAQYPRDLGSSTKSHSVFFTIEEVAEMGLEGLYVLNREIADKGEELVGDGVDTFSSIGETLSAGWNNFTGNAESNGGGVKGYAVAGLDSFVGGLDSAAQGIQGVTNFLNQRQGAPVGYISLYMPENFSLSQTSTYDDNTTLADAAGALPIIGKIVSKVTGAINNDAARVVLNKAGYVFNPQKQMLFQGIEFRTFDMSFTFTPYSQREAADINKIITMFRKYAAPKASSALSFEWQYQWKSVIIR